MHLEGAHHLPAPVDVVWNMLMNPDTLAKVTPGISSLESTGADTYNAISEIKMGPVSGSFKGTMEVVDKKEPEQFTLKIKQKSKIGNVNATGTIFLKPEGKTTEVQFSGDAKLSGTLARTGQRVLSGVAKTLTNQFFEALEGEIQLSQGKEVKKKGFFARLAAWFKAFFS